MKKSTTLIKRMINDRSCFKRFMKKSNLKVSYIPMNSFLHDLNYLKIVTLSYLSVGYNFFIKEKKIQISKNMYACESTGILRLSCYVQQIQSNIQTQANIGMKVDFSSGQQEKQPCANSITVTLEQDVGLSLNCFWMMS